jgi:hypothetical protein
LTLNAKGGEINRPKKKDRTTTLFSKNFFQKGGENNRHLQKPSWQLRGELLQVELLFSLRKSIWNGQNLSKLENVFRNNILIPLANCKRI